VVFNLDLIGTGRILLDDQTRRDALVAIADSLDCAAPTSEDDASTDTTETAVTTEPPETTATTDTSDDDEADDEDGTTGDEETFEECVDKVRTSIEEVGLPLGWHCEDDPDATSDVKGEEAETTTATTNNDTTAAEEPEQHRCSVLDVFDDDDGLGENFEQNVSAHILGWLLAAGAITMGAPFWYDLVTKLTGYRKTMKDLASRATGS
jgi:hypothetical protein